MKAFFLADTDLEFVSQKIDVPRVRVIRYLPDGTAMYGYTNPVTGQVVELGALGSFDLMTSSWSAFLPNNANITNTPSSPFGVRNVDGLFNNLTNPATQAWGAVGTFARSSNSEYKITYINPARI